MAYAHRQYKNLNDAIVENNGVECEQAPDAFFIDQSDENRAYKVKLAKSICDQCPVKFLCLEYALESYEQEGIWGGTTPWERRALRRNNVA